MEDVENDIHCELNVGADAKRPCDYVTGNIIMNGKVVSKIEGSYCSHIKIDGKIYYDWRYSVPHRIRIKKSVLPSDWRLRKDITELKKGKSNYLLFFY